jgi:hypothetical protein
LAWQFSATSLLDVQSCFGDWALELRVAYCDFLDFEVAMLLPIVPQTAAAVGPSAARSPIPITPPVIAPRTRKRKTSICRIMPVIEFELDDVWVRDAWQSACSQPSRKRCLSLVICRLCHAASPPSIRREHLGNVFQHVKINAMAPLSDTIDRPVRSGVV